MSKAVLNRLLVAGLVGLSLQTHAYQVWTGTCKTPEWVLDELDNWDLVAPHIGGLNSNFAPALGNPDYNPSTEQWAQIISHYTTGKNHAMLEYGHPDNQPTGSETVVTVEIATAWLLGKFDLVQSRGMSVVYVMFYDMGGSDGKINAWKADEVANLRTALNQLGRSDIKLAYNCRSNQAFNKLFWPGVEVTLNEGNTEQWMTNVAGRQDLLRNVMADPVLRTRPFIFQMTTHNDFEEKKVGDNIDAYQAMRQVMRFISTDILGSTDFVRSDNGIFMPLSYAMFPTNFPFTPEHTPDGHRYGNSMTGLLLSMVEQKAMFEGRAPGGLITLEQCNSFDRARDFVAVADGPLTNSAVWNGTPPVSGDYNRGPTGSHTLGAQGAAGNSTVRFHGECLAVQTNGVIDPMANTITLSLNKLVLDGGTLSHLAGSGRLTVDLNGHAMELNAGTLKAGGLAGQNQEMVFASGALTGSGTIHVEAAGAAGYPVRFDASMDTSGFTGNFLVRSNGVLDLPDTDVGTMGLRLSGTGKYRMDGSVYLASLAIDGTFLPAGLYLYNSLTPAQQAFFINAGGSIRVFGDITGVQTGNLNDPATWGGIPAPLEGDANVWKSGPYALGGQGTEVNGSLAFHGGSLVIQNGGMLSPDVAGLNLTVNHLVLDGGTITMTRFYPFDVDLNGKAFTLNSGTIEAGKGTQNRHIYFRNGRLAGHGTIDITSKGDTGYRVDFKDTIDASGFHGIFNVLSPGTLTLPSVGTPSFRLHVETGGKVAMPAMLALRDLNLNGESIMGGVYGYTNLTAEQQACFVNFSSNDVLKVLNGTALQNGHLNHSATWGGLDAPVAGDTDVWRTGTNTLTCTGEAADSTAAFHGDTLVLDEGGGFRPDSPGLTLSLNNLILNGGTLRNDSAHPFIVDLNGAGLVLHGGVILAGSGTDAAADLHFRNGTVYGAGAVDIGAEGAARSRVVAFENTMDMGGFSGMLNVRSNGTLRLHSKTIEGATFGIRLSSGCRLDDADDDTLRLAYFEIDGVGFPVGSYSYGDFTPEQQAMLASTTGRLVVENVFYNQWAAEYDQLVGGYRDDDDGDGLDNYFEYALGGDPLDPDNRGHVPEHAIVPGSGGTRWFRHVHAERTGLTGSPLRYVVERSNSLATNTWTTSGIDAAGAGPLSSEFISVTNRILMNGNNHQFIRVRVE